MLKRAAYRFARRRALAPAQRRTLQDLLADGLLTAGA
jgi:hypothetical protein